MAVLYRRHDRFRREGPRLCRRFRSSRFHCKRRTVHYDEALRNLEHIGEAAARVPDPIRAEHPQIPWRLLIATRNRLIHGYLGLDDDVLWSIIEGDVPALLTDLRALKTKLG